jgi:UDP-N-acetylmuramoyl-L-alanyl-D-glutamate--2,6-diaminopimelate ligase
MMNLKQLIGDLECLQVIGGTDITIAEIQFDSRAVGSNSLFVAVKGTLTDGHLFIDKAIGLGASAIICEELPKEIDESVTYIQVSNSAFALALVAAEFYGHPSSKLKLVGITGTNGKTTVATLLQKLFTELGYHAGLLSTVQNLVGERVVASTHTTPDPLALNKLLSEMVDEGCDYCFMEVSSHAVTQHRIDGLNFAGGVFTNLSHDHLDFHKTFDEYIRAKKTFFDHLPKHSFALTNADDKNGMVMLQNTAAFKKTYALRTLADYKGKVLESHFNGMLMSIDGNELWVRLIGNFNAYNILATYGTALLLEQDRAKVLMILSRITGAAGRFETIISPDGIIGIVDYAHTPDALENVLKTILDLRQGTTQVITVVGCGGDRDKTKRPEMAEVAVRMSDKVIFTSDNPRSEEPLGILKDMEAGVPADKKRKYFTISDRREAIRAACHLALSGDIVLVAGKGHETYQEVKGVRHAFDDKEVLIESFNEK